MKKKLEYVFIDGAPGGNQDWLQDWDMYHGGCAAVTACDVCIYLAGRDNFPALCPCDPQRPSREDFIRFSQIMKPYLTPRFHGIDFLEIYLTGLSDYWQDTGYNGMCLEGLSGNVPFETARAVIQTQLESGFPVPYLMLHHKNPAFEDFEWHWFNLTGFEEIKNEDQEEDLLVEAVTYSEARWLNLRELWNTEEERRGGVIRLFRKT